MESGAPSARSGSHSLFYDNKVWFFGGYTRKGGAYFNDLTYFDVVTGKWSTIECASKPAPLPRTDHSFVRHNEFFYVYGGRDETHIFSDVIQFDPTSF